MKHTFAKKALLLSAFMVLLNSTPIDAMDIEEEETISLDEPEMVEPEEDPEYTTNNNDNATEDLTEPAEMEEFDVDVSEEETPEMEDITEEKTIETIAPTTEFENSIELDEE